MGKSILSEIPTTTLVGSPEPVTFYRLGFFNGSSYDLAELTESLFYPPHYHKRAEGWLHFVLGEGVLILDGKEMEYSSGFSCHVPKGVRHGFRPKTRTLILSIQTPPVKDPNGKEDLHYDPHP